MNTYTNPVFNELIVLFEESDRHYLGQESEPLNEADRKRTCNFLKKWLNRNAVDISE